MYWKLAFSEVLNDIESISKHTLFAGQNSNRSPNLLQSKVTP